MAFDIRDDDDEHPMDEFDEYDDVSPKQRPKFYRRRKFWYCCIPTSIISVVVIVVLALYVIMPKIAQGLMDNATIELSQIDITSPSATSMDIVMKGEMKHTGPFHADITFPGIVQVSWNGIELGTTEIPGKSSVAGGSGDLDLQSTFIVTNQTGFTEFSSYMLNSESFVWHLEGKLNVKALGHTVKDLNLKKDITVSAFNGMPGVKIEKFALPGDDPSGKGIIIELDTVLTNPSAIQMFMGSLTLAITYKNTLVGYVTSSNLTMLRGTQTMSLKGVLIPQTTVEGLADTSEMMSNYIGFKPMDTIATGFDVKPDGVTSVGWLANAVKNLKLTVPLQSPTPLQLIKGLNLGALGLVFTPPTAYQPITTSTGVLANYTLPDGFGFNIQFSQVANAFTLSRGGVAIANINSTYNPSSSNMAASTLTFDLLATPLVVPDASHVPFQEFNRDLTVGANLPFEVVGFASVYANTSIGTVNLVNIPFNASTELSGLQSLGNPQPTITALQVVEGTSTALTMAITVVIVNPSSISLSADDIILDLHYKNTRLGTVTMPSLAIVPGANTVQATSSIDPAASPEGMELLTLYTSGAGAGVTIVGTPSSTKIESLSLAFGALNIGSQMPGLETKLLAGATLTVLNTTLADGLAETVVTINNPFVPAMSILAIDAKITYGGASLGTVVASYSSPPVIPGTGKGTVTAALALNTNPMDLVHLIRAQAVKNGLNTDAFDALLALQQGGNPPSSLFENFNVADFVIKAMAGLEVDISMSTTVKLGDYQLTMSYSQPAVPVSTDQTILKLIPIVGTPIAQLLVDHSVLAFESIMIGTPGETSFPTDIIGAITETGPLDAVIQFPNPVTISYNGKAIGSMMMPTVNAVANKGAPLNLANIPFTIVDLDAFTQFNIFAVNNPKFEWTISTTGLVVTAMGAALPGVSMTKTVTLDGFNKLAGLQLLSYQITGIDDAGMHMVISASMSNPSTIGMSIPLSTFTTQFHGLPLGPASAAGLTLLPHGTSSFALNATIATGLGDRKAILSGVFQNALNGVETPLDAQGTGAPGVSWLDAAIKSLLLHTSLPPLTAPPIEAVTIDAMEMDFACETCVWNPTAISTITAKTNLPFVNGAPIVKLSQNVEILDKNGAVVGVLSTTYADAVSTGNTVKTTTSPAPLAVGSGSHEIYSAFVGDLNVATTYELGLRGTADSILDLGALGQIEVKGIKLDVRTSLDGLQGLQNIKYISLLSIDTPGGGTAVTSLVNIHNPSKLTLTLGNIYLKCGYDTTEANYAGISTILNMKLVPGDNYLPNYVFFEAAHPAGTKISNEMYYMDVKLVLYAYDKSSPNPALNAGLQGLVTSTVLPAGAPEVKSADPYGVDWALNVLPTTVNDGYVEMTAMFGNPYFNLELHVTSGVALPPVVTNPLVNAIQPDMPFNRFDLFKFLPEFKYNLKPNETASITFKMKLNDELLPGRRAALQKIANTTSYPIAIPWGPVVTVGNDPTPFSPYWDSDFVYGERPAKPKMSIPSNFNLIIQYYLKKWGLATTTVAPVAAPTSTTTVAPVPTPATTTTTVAPAPTPTTSTTEAPAPIPTPAATPSPVTA